MKYKTIFDMSIQEKFKFTKESLILGFALYIMSQDWSLLVDNDWFGLSIIALSGFTAISAAQRLFIENDEE